jgi:hypothetical protein
MPIKAIIYGIRLRFAFSAFRWLMVFGWPSYNVPTDWAHQRSASYENRNLSPKRARRLGNYSSSSHGTRSYSSAAHRVADR